MRILFVTMFIFVSFLGHAQDCPEGDLEFFNQSQVDSFPLLYPDCQCVNGDLLVKSTIVNPIYDIDSLYSIRTIKGSLVIRDNIALSDFEGLNNVDSIYKSLYIRSNFSLLNIEALSNLEYFGTGFIFRDNYKLESFRGLENISLINGTFDVTNNNKLVDFSGLENVEIIKGFFQVNDNDKLESFEGLNRVKSAGGNFHVKDNPKLRSFEGFDSLEVIGFTIQMGGNTLLHNFEGLDRLVKLEGGIDMFGGNIQNLKGLEQLDSIFDLYIVDQPRFTSFEALKDLEYIGSLSIANVDSLESLKGLENITQIDGYLRFRFNENLSDLTALSQVDKIEGDLWIDDNASLESLKGLENIDPATIEENVFAEIPDLIIRNNPVLSDCIFKNICDFISNDLGEFDIKNNGASCLNEDVISENCMLLSNVTPDKNEIKVYPNPFVSAVTIETPEEDMMSVVDMDSRVIMVRKIKGGQNVIQLNNLKPGLYILNTIKSGRFKVLKI